MTKTDQNTARQLLAKRSRGGRIEWKNLLASKFLWMATITSAGLIVWSMNESDNLFLNRSVWFLAGILGGRILRDIVWMRAGANAFPFLNKVIDWTKVEDLANGNLRNDTDPT